MLPSVEKMRQILHELSLLDDTRVSTFILKKNIDYFIEEDTDYYIDGHFEEYTGEADILQGWSTVKNRVSKGNIDYFVHDGSLRDYQKVFRKLIRTGGEIDISDDIMYIKLDFFGRKKFREKCNRYFDKFNSQKIRTMDGKYMWH